MRPHRYPLTTVSVAALSLFALAGCAPAGTETAPTASASTSPTPAASQTAAPMPTAAPATGTDTPLTIGCDTLITGQDLYDFNPNYAPQPNYSPAAGSSAAEAMARGGIACAWVNLTSGDTIEFAAAQPAPERLEALTNALVGSSNSVPTFGMEGFFSTASGVGIADAFPGAFWITAKAASFIEPGDAEPLMRAAISHLR
jgi:hypothetical protein